MPANSLGDTTIFGDGVALRTVKQEDFGLLFNWLNDPEVYRWWGGMPIDSKVVQQKYLGLRRPKIEGYIIEVAEIPIGYAQRSQTGDDGGGVDLFLVPEMRGHGYGGAAAKTLIDYLIRVEGWKRITVDPERENALAQRFWRKLGFVETEEIASQGNLVLIYRGTSRQSPDGESL